MKKSVQDVSGFFWRAAYNVGGRRYSAHDIEHGILRANAAYPAIPGRQFSRRDPRRQYSLVAVDARVHFTLVCAARSCPPIAVYDADHIDEQLDLATRTFANGGGVTIDPQAKVIWLSQIFQWYAPDFGAAPSASAVAKPCSLSLRPTWPAASPRLYCRPVIGASAFRTTIGASMPTPAWLTKLRIGRQENPNRKVAAFRRVYALGQQSLFPVAKQPH